MQTNSIENSWVMYARRPRSTTREKLIVSCLPLVKHIVNRVAAALPSSVDTTDLMSCGVLGLMDAIKKFDRSSPKEKFQRYATVRIRGAVIDQLRKIDWVSQAVRRDARRIQKASERLHEKLGRGATNDEVVQELTISHSRLNKVHRETSSPQLLSLQDPWSGNNGEDLGCRQDTLACHSSPDPVKTADAKETRAQLVATLGNLPNKERSIIRMYYYEDRTLKEIGQLLGVTESRICQIHSKVLQNLRGLLQPLHSAVVGA